MRAAKSWVRTVGGRLLASTRGMRRGLRGRGVIIAFHRVNDRTADDALTRSTADYEAFCRFFRAHFDVVGLGDLIARLEAGESLEGKLAITHDDGYLDNFEHAAPILAKVDVPATFFVSSGYMGTDRVAPWDADVAEHVGWMSWDQVRSLRDAGFEIGAHTCNHVDLGRVPVDEARTELVESRRELEAQLGQTIDLFAYPFGGRANICADNLQVVREVGYRCCLSCHGGLAKDGDDPFALPRVPISPWYQNPDHLAFDLARTLA